MTQVRFNDLTTEQLDILRSNAELNGCGGKGGWLNPPDWIFTASCDHHDFNYWLGGTELDRSKADWQFYQAMLVDVENTSWWKRPWYKMVAWVYYTAVRKFASSFFSYDDTEKTLEDVLAIVGKSV